MKTVKLEVSDKTYKWFESCAKSQFISQRVQAVRKDQIEKETLNIMKQSLSSLAASHGRFV